MPSPPIRLTQEQFDSLLKYINARANYATHPSSTNMFTVVKTLSEAESLLVEGK
jgi:hypothetical protein